MIRHLTLLVLFAAGLSLALAVPPPAPLRAAPAAEFDVDAVAAEVRVFYADYWKAWDERDASAIAARLAPDFVGLLYVAPQGVVQLDKAHAIAGVRQFFDAVRGRETLWSRRLLAVVPRSPTEAIAAVRSDFALREAGGEVELTLEVLRKDSDGRWRLVRKWSEKHVL